MNNLYSVDFTRLLPPSLKSDPKILALANVIAEQLRTTAHEIEKNIIFARIDVLDEKTLDILAHDLHVDWYNYTYPVEVKRATIKDSVKVHRRLGTKYAVETALGNVFPGARIEEWFEYGGIPHTFRIVLDIDIDATQKQFRNTLHAISLSKRLSAHLDGLGFSPILLNTPYVSAPVIKCKKTPIKKCRFMAGGE